MLVFNFFNVTSWMTLSIFMFFLFHEGLIFPDVNLFKQNLKMQKNKL